MCEDLKALFSSRPKSAEIGTTDQRFPEQLSPSALWEMPRNPQRVLPAHPPAESTKRRRRLYAAKQRRCSSLALKPRPRPPPPHRSWDQASVSVDILASCSKSFEGKRREHINTTAVAGRKNCSYFLIDKTEGRSCLQFRCCCLGSPSVLCFGGASAPPSPTRGASLGIGASPASKTQQPASCMGGSGVVGRCAPLSAALQLGHSSNRGRLAHTEAPGAPQPLDPSSPPQGSLPVPRDGNQAS